VEVEEFRRKLKKFYVPKVIDEKMKMIR